MIVMLLKKLLTMLMKNKLFISLLVFMLLSVFLLGNQSYGSVLLDRIVATVNGEVITWSELMSVVMHEGKPYLENVPEDEKQKRIKELSRRFLNDLIESKLQIQEAHRMGLEVSDSEIDSAINEIKEKFSLSEETFMNSLRAENMTLRDYRKRLADQILIQKVINFAVRSKVVVSDKDINEYYRVEKVNQINKEQLKIRQIFFSSPPEADQKRSIEKKANDIFQMINEGRDFAALAREFSEGPNREAGGDLGYISSGSALKEIEDVARSLEVGEVSRPFWGPAGLHIIKLEDRKTGTDVEEFKEEIKNELFQKTFEMNYHEWVAELRERANIEIKL